MTYAELMLLKIDKEYAQLVADGKIAENQCPARLILDDPQTFLRCHKHWQHREAHTTSLGTEFE